MGETTQTAGDRRETPEQRAARWDRERAAEDRQALDAWDTAAGWIAEDILDRTLNAMFGARGDRQQENLLAVFNRLGHVDWMLDESYDEDLERKIGRIVRENVHRRIAGVAGVYLLGMLERATRPGDEGREAWNDLEEQVARWKEQASERWEL